MKINHNSNFNTNNRIFSLDDLIVDLLPHGSGIDGKWNIEQDKKGNIYCLNSFTCYNENGMLDTYVNFSIKLKLVNMELHVVQLSFVGKHSQYYANKYQLRDYLESVFFDVGNMQAIAICNNAQIDITRYL